jgi:hypothetical protein
MNPVHGWEKAPAQSRKANLRVHGNGPLSAKTAIQMTTLSSYSFAIPIRAVSAPSIGQAYRTKESFLAVQLHPAGKGEIVSLPRGAMLRIIGLSSCLPEGIEVARGDQVYNIFIVDLLARSTNLTSAACWEPSRRRGADQSGTPCGQPTQSA